MPTRSFSANNTYRYGFNGKEQDKDMHSLTAYDYGFRIYNPAIGKFLSVDPLMKDYPWYTPYQFAGNMPIWAIDLDGLEPTLPQLLSWDFMLLSHPKHPVTRFATGFVNGAWTILKSAFQSQPGGRGHSDPDPEEFPSVPEMIDQVKKDAKTLANGSAEEKGEVVGQWSPLFFLKSPKKPSKRGPYSPDKPIVNTTTSETLEASTSSNTTAAKSNASTTNVLNTGLSAEMQAIPHNKVYGSIYLRLFKYGYYWKNASLKDVINKFTPGVDRVFNALAGKATYTNSKTGIQVVHDIPSNYFRIFDKNGNPLNLKGEIATGTNAEIQQNTHFLNSDYTTLPSVTDF